MSAHRLLRAVAATVLLACLKNIRAEPDGASLATSGCMDANTIERGPNRHCGGPVGVVAAQAAGSPWASSWMINGRVQHDGGDYKAR